MSSRAPAYSVVLPRDPGAPILVESNSRLWIRAWPGTAWRAAKVPRLARLWGYQPLFIAAKTGWLVTAHCNAPVLSVLFRTTNGGRTWGAADPRIGVSCAAGTYLDLDFVDDRHGWMIAKVGNSTFTHLVATSDGGRTWRDRAIELTLRGDIHFLDAHRGWLVTSTPYIAQEIARTLDGGRTWAEPRIKIPSSYAKFDPCVLGPPRLFGKSGVLPALLRRSDRNTLGFFQTRDSGATWTLAVRRELDHRFRNRDVTDIETCPLGQILVRVATPTVWWLVTGGGRIAMHVTRDGGGSWHRVALPGFRNPTLADVQSWDEDRALLTLSNARDTRLFSTADGGTSWQRIRLPAALLRG